jgi:exodeoxyribonuclease VII large subunit
MNNTRRRLDHAYGLLNAYSYQGVLDRGFAVVLDAKGGVVRASASISSGDALTLRFKDGETGAVATSGAPRPAAKPAGKKSDKQDDLFG